MTDMKLCCGSNLYASHSFETSLKEMSEIGIRYVDIWSSPAICDHANPERDSVDEIRELLLKYEMTAVSMSLFLVNDEDRMRRMRFASQLGIPMVIWEPAQSVDWDDNMGNLNPCAVPFGEDKGTFLDYAGKLTKYLKAAQEMNLRVGIEVPHCYTFNEYLFQIYRLDQEIKEDGLSYIIAPSHCSARGYEAEDVYRMVAPERVSMLYLWDVKKDFRFPESDRAFGSGEEQLPGGGQRDFERQISNFRKMGFQGWYNISVHGTEGWKNCKKVTEHLKKSYDLVSPLLNG